MGSEKRIRLVIGQSVVLPNLTPANHQITSPPTPVYNCIAWAAGNNDRWWWPDPMNVYYWPPGVPREVTVNAFVVAYALLGYKLTMDASLEPDVEKIALYGKTEWNGQQTPTHAALQLTSGKWTSKLGKAEDIQHDSPADVEGPVYGRVICFFSRPR